MNTNSIYLSKAAKNSSRPLIILGSLASILIGWMTYEGILDGELDKIIKVQEMQLTRSQVVFGREIGDMEHTITLLKNMPSFKSAIGVGQEVNQELAGQLFSQFISSVDSLLQVRWLDKSGMEIIRVNSENGVAQIVPKPFLQNKSNRYYFTQGIAVPEDKVYLSPLDLNVEHKKIEIPLRPTIRVTTRTGKLNRLPEGLIILNYDIGYILDYIRSFNTDVSKIEIVDSKGFWIINPNRELEWGLDLKQKQHNMKIMFPQLWEQMQTRSNTSGAIVDVGMLSYQCNDIDKSFVKSASFSNDSQLCFISVTPEKVLISLRWQAGWKAGIFSISIFLIWFWLLNREKRMSQELIDLNSQLNIEKRQIEETSKYNQALLKQQQTLQDDLVESRKLSALGMMVAGVAHELNTPIGAAMMAASKMKVDHEALTVAFKSGLTKTALETYLKNNALGLDLVEQNQNRASLLIKSFKRLAIDRVKDDVVAFSLKQVIDDLLRTLHSTFKFPSLEVKCDVEDIVLSGYPGIFSQILQNLITNAITHAFTPEHDNKLSITAYHIADMVEISVADNGKGISPEMKQTIFDPFVTTKRSQGNTGLGMHFVHQWVTKSLKGTIQIESTLGKGTTFYISIPREIKVNLPED
ncbi:sensor histidine kinase [Vibrio viridaestus]|uniref:histidine kinase n=1 Tax=Vibrio viridaestus TaxID=2487322 RepID=A0A3N9TKJ7_9VIBR|nr:HAMP domain-containing sensor histidine kinase [Vibrio viridaestus]RQW64514.1 sensor histidine kinase [Vibrio viridaestus]